MIPFHLEIALLLTVLILMRDIGSDSVEVNDQKKNNDFDCTLFATAVFFWIITLFDGHYNIITLPLSLLIAVLTFLFFKKKNNSK